ncbi:MAG: hypothetical protein LUQ31_02050 [Methanoregula sp.]|nr:hypothetical protein [Methanoregula sp.]
MVSIVAITLPAILPAGKPAVFPRGKHRPGSGTKPVSEESIYLTVHY